MAQKKKNLIFSLMYYPNNIGGAEVAIDEITKRLNSEEYEFHMVCLRYDRNLPKTETIGNVTVHRFGVTTKDFEQDDTGRWPLRLNKYWFLFGAAFKAMSLHRQYRFDLTWAMMAHPCGVPQAIFKLFNPAVPSVLTLQEGDPIDYMERLYTPLWPLFKRAFTTANKIQVISTFLGQWAKKMGYEGEIVFVPNGASASAELSKDGPTLDELRTQIGQQPGDVQLVTVSRLVHKNAVDDIVTALTHLPAHVKLLVVGDGDDKPALEAQVAALDLSDRVYFTGHVDRSLTAKYRAISDIFIRPSRTEGFGNSFASAMASRLPVIATQEGGIIDFLHDPERNPAETPTGFAVDADAPEQIAAKVEYILAHPELTERVVANAYEMVMTTYNWDHIAKKMDEDVFQAVLKKD